jgi:hypothetical protein
MELKNNVTQVRRFAVAAVLVTVAVTLGAAALLPRELLVLLPIFGLTLPLLSTGVLEAMIDQGPRTTTPQH